MIRNVAWSGNYWADDHMGVPHIMSWVQPLSLVAILNRGNPYVDTQECKCTVRILSDSSHQTMNDKPLVYLHYLGVTFLSPRGVSRRYTAVIS
jgi:hypothetical protein